MTKITNTKIALVLGGGSARGLAHIGFLKVFKKYNIPVDLIVGTSIGSLAGACFSLGIPISKMEAIANKITWRQLTDFIISKMGFLEGKNFEKIISEATEDKGFDNLNIPLAITATDIEKGELVVYTSGNLQKIIRASCSIPGIFLPIRMDGRTLVDGGIKNTVPSEVARRLGAKFIIAVDVGYCIKKGRVSNIFQVVFQAIQISGNELNKHQSKQADFPIKIHLSDDIDQMAFDKSEEIIEAGVKAAEETMPILIEQLKEEGYIST